MNEIEFTKKEAKRLIKLLSDQVERSNEGSSVKMIVKDYDISIQVDSGSGILNSGFYRSRDGVKKALLEAVDAGKKLAS